MLISRRKRKRMRTRGKRRWKTRETTRGNKRWKRRGRKMGWEGSGRNTRQYGERFVPSQHRDGHKRATYHLMTK